MKAFLKAYLLGIFFEDASGGATHPTVADGDTPDCLIHSEGDTFLHLGIPLSFPFFFFLCFP